MLDTLDPYQYTLNPLDPHQYMLNPLDPSQCLTHLTHPSTWSIHLTHTCTCFTHLTHTSTCSTHLTHTSTCSTHLTHPSMFDSLNPSQHMLKPPDPYQHMLNPLDPSQCILDPYQHMYPHQTHASIQWGGFGVYFHFFPLLVSLSLLANADILTFPLPAKQHCTFTMQINTSDLENMDQEMDHTWCPHPPTPQLLHPNFIFNKNKNKCWFLKREKNYTRNKKIWTWHYKNSRKSRRVGRYVNVFRPICLRLCLVSPLIHCRFLYHCSNTQTTVLTSSAWRWLVRVE